MNNELAWCDPFCFWCRYLHDTAPPDYDFQVYMATQRAYDVSVAARIPVCDRHAFWALIDTGTEFAGLEGSGYLLAGPQQVP